MFYLFLPAHSQFRTVEESRSVCRGGRRRTMGVNSGVIPKAVLLVVIIVSWLPNLRTQSKKLTLEDFPFCQRDFLIVYSLNFTSDYLQQDPYVDLSVLESQKFLEISESSYKKNTPHCLLILQDFNDLTTNTIRELDIEVKAKSLVTSSELLERKTIVIFINYLSIAFSEHQQRDYLLNSQTHQPTELNLDFYYIFTSLENEVMHVWETYSIKDHPIANEFHTSSLNDGIYNESMSSTLNNKVSRRKNFTDIPIVGIIRNNQPDWMDFTRTKDKKIILTSGFSTNIYWDLQLMLNFSEMAVIGDGVKTLPNRTLGGTTVSMLNSGEADLSLSQSTLVPFRATQLTFLQPTYSGIIHVFFKQPAANSIRNIVTAPFRTSLWIVLICTWVFFVIVVKISSLVQRYPLRRNPKQSFASQIDLQQPPEDDRLFASQVAMWTFAANCQKSWHSVPSSSSMRLMFLMGLFCGVVTYVAYSGEIVSTLAVTVTPVKQFMQLIQYKFTFTVHEWSEPFQVFLQLLIDQYSLPQQVRKISTEIEIAHLLDHKEPAAFFTYPDAFYSTALDLNYTPQFICKNIHKIIFSHVPTTSGLFLKKGSTFTETFNHKLLMIKERGLNFRYVNIYDTKTSISCTNDNSAQSFDPVTLVDVFTAFLVISVGLAFSIVLSFIERLCYKYT